MSTTINVKVTNRFLDSGFVALSYEDNTGAAQTTVAQYMQGTPSGNTAVEQPFVFTLTDANTAKTFAVQVFYGQKPANSSLYRNESFSFSSTGTTNVNMSPLGTFNNGWAMGFGIFFLVAIVVAIIVAIAMAVYYSYNGNRSMKGMEGSAYGTTSFFVSGQQ